MLNSLFSFLSGSAFGFLLAVYWLYRTCRSRWLVAWKFLPPPASGVRAIVPRPKPHPNSPSAVEARPEVEGNAFSTIP